MLVTTTENGWKIIYQRAHGLLAAQLALHWKSAYHTPYWLHTLVAIAEHDDGMAESNSAENLTEAGTPKHFQQLEYSVEQYQNVMEIAASKSRWNALMTSMHLTFLYGPKQAEDKKLRAFIKEQEALQKKLCRELKISQAKAKHSYRLVEWCDALSLLLCMEKVQPQQRRMDISTGPDGNLHQLWQDADGYLHVDPWPFAESLFEVSVEYRLVNQVTFQDTNAFSQAMRQAPVLDQVWAFREK